MHHSVGSLIFFSISHLSIIPLLDFPFQSRLQGQLDVITLWMCWVRKWFLCPSLRAGLPPQPQQQALRLASTLLLKPLQCEWKCLIQSHVRVERVWKFWRLAVLRSGCSLGWEQFLCAMLPVEFLTPFSLPFRPHGCSTCLRLAQKLSEQVGFRAFVCCAFTPISNSYHQTQSYRQIPKPIWHSTISH